MVSNTEHLLGFSKFKSLFCDYCFILILSWQLKLFKIEDEAKCQIDSPDMPTAWFESKLQQADAFIMWFYNERWYD